MLPSSPPRSTPLPTRIKLQDRETQRKGLHLAFIMSIITLSIVGLIAFAFIIGFNNPGLKPPKEAPITNPTLSEARPHTNCSDFNGAINFVQRLAGGEGYLHVFEYERYHPCCVKQKDLLQTLNFSDDVVFVVMTSQQTRDKARAVLNSWGRGLENLLFISDLADPDMPLISLGEVSGGQNFQATPTFADKQHRQIWAMKYIDSDPHYAHLRSKKWFFLADDSTWVNIPALLDLISRYDERCPVAFGYVWSHIWMEDFDYIAGGAGLLLSNLAFKLMTPAFYTADCPFGNYNDITFGRCAWALKVQLVHHRGFYFDPPERSKDRHEVVWFPPVAEAISYHYVHPEEMGVMTTYVNERWQYQPKEPVLQANTIAVTPSDDDDPTLPDIPMGNILPVDMRFIRSIKEKYPDVPAP